MSVVPPFTWAKYFDPTLPTATIQPTTIRWHILEKRTRQEVKSHRIMQQICSARWTRPCSSCWWLSVWELQFFIIRFEFNSFQLKSPWRQPPLQGHPSLHYLWAATGATTFLSAVSYAFMKDTYKFSHKEYDHQFGKKLFAFVLFILVNIGFTLTFPAKVGPCCTLEEQLMHIFSANGEKWSRLPNNRRTWPLQRTYQPILFENDQES